MESYNGGGVFIRRAHLCTFCPFYSFSFLVLVEDREEMVGVLASDIFDAKVIDN